MKKILTILLLFLCLNAQAQVDKLYHFVAGVGISYITTNLTYGITDNRVKAAWWGFGIGTGIGIAKEVADILGEGNAEVLDGVSTAAGAAGMAILLNELYKKWEIREGKFRGVAAIVPGEYYGVSLRIRLWEQSNKG